MYLDALCLRTQLTRAHMPTPSIALNVCMRSPHARTTIGLSPQGPLLGGPRRTPILHMRGANTTHLSPANTKATSKQATLHRCILSIPLTLRLAQAPTFGPPDTSCSNPGFEPKEMCQRPGMPATQAKNWLKMAQNGPRLPQTVAGGPRAGSVMLCG